MNIWTQFGSICDVSLLYIAQQMYHSFIVMPGSREEGSRRIMTWSEIPSFLLGQFTLNAVFEVEEFFHVFHLFFMCLPGKLIETVGN